MQKDNSSTINKQNKYILTFLAILLPSNFLRNFYIWFIPSFIETLIFLLLLANFKKYRLYQPIILAFGMGIGAGSLMDTIAFRVIAKTSLFVGGDGSIAPAYMFSLATSVIVSMIIIKVLDRLETIKKHDAQFKS